MGRQQNISFPAEAALPRQLRTDWAGWAAQIESFDFSDYGSIEDGTANTSTDPMGRAAMSASDQNSRSGGKSGNEAPQGPVYQAKIRLECGAMNKARSNLCDRITPRMSVQAEIMTGERRIIQYLLSPLSQTVSEAGREK